MIINPYYDFVVLCKAFEAENIEIIKIDMEQMKIFLAVPKRIKLEKVKTVVHALIGEHMRVFCKVKEDDENGNNN